jgi:C-terminal processing protease CtpA/Prc
MFQKLLKSVTLTVLIAGTLASQVTAQAQALTLSGRFAVAYSGYETIPLIVGLTDASGFFAGDPVYLAPSDKQMIGDYTGNATGGNYFVTLPNVPQGRDIDIRTGDLSEDSGVRIYDVRLLTDVPMRGYMAGNEDPIASSLRLSVDSRVTGGTLIAFADESDAQFPTGYGADGELFTADDPLGTISKGYNLIDLETDPFTVSYEFNENSRLDLITTGIGDVNDYRSLSCAELIPTFVDRVAQYYPFTELNEIDWQALRDEVLPASQTAQSAAECQTLIRTVANAIPDGHVNFNLPALAGEWNGSTGLRAIPTSDGQVVVTLVRPGSSADQAGIQRGAILLEWDGVPILEAAENVLLQYSNASTPHALQAIQLNQLQRGGSIGSSVEVTFTNPGESAPQTVTIVRDSPQRVNEIMDELPVSDDKLPSGVGYIRIPDFGSIDVLYNFDETLDKLIAENVPGIVIDVRGNPGGLSQIADALASRFYTEAFIVGELMTEDGRITYMSAIDPRESAYTGAVAVLVDRNSASAAELFAYSMSLNENVVIVGNTPSGGLAGTVSGGQYLLPNDAFIQVPTGAFIDQDGGIIVEGAGVVPDVVVPLSAESILSPQDEVLLAAEQAVLEAVAQ